MRQGNWENLFDGSFIGKVVRGDSSYAAPLNYKLKLETMHRPMWEKGRIIYATHHVYF